MYSLQTLAALLGLCEGNHLVVPLPISWWMHSLQTLSALPALCEGIHQWSMIPRTKDQWCCVVMFSLYLVSIIFSTNIRFEDDLRWHDAHMYFEIELHIPFLKGYWSLVKSRLPLYVHQSGGDRFSARDLGFKSSQTPNPTTHYPHPHKTPDHERKSAFVVLNGPSTYSVTFWQGLLIFVQPSL